MPKIFLDTNIMLYAFTDDAPSAIAEALLGRGTDMSVQVLNEFTNVARRKFGLDWGEVEQALQDGLLIERRLRIENPFGKAAP